MLRTDRHSKYSQELKTPTLDTRINMGIQTRGWGWWVGSKGSSLLWEVLRYWQVIRKEYRNNESIVAEDGEKKHWEPGTELKFTFQVERQLLPTENTASSFNSNKDGKPEFNFTGRILEDFSLKKLNSLKYLWSNKMGHPGSYSTLL